MNSDLSAHPDTDIGHMLLRFCLLALWFLQGCAIGFPFKAPLCFQLGSFFSVLGSLLLCLPFFFFPPLEGNKSKGHLILLIPLTRYSFHRKEVNKFLMSYAGNKSSVSSNQSWVSRVHSCFNPSTPASSRRSRVWAQRPPRAAELVWHVGSGATSWLTQSC